MKLLLVEDDFDLSTALSRSLAARGWDVMCCADGTEALAAARKQRFDALVLDLSLPGLDGLELLARLRGDGNTTPVLVLTARAAVGQRVAGLEAGADDYLAKPFDLEELVARLRALTRRLGRDGELRCGALRWEPSTRSFWREGVPLELSPREAALLQSLMSRVDQVVTKDALHAALYGAELQPAQTDAVEVLVHRLRRKLADAHVEILTLRGVGYLLCDGASSAAQRLVR